MHEIQKDLVHVVKKDRCGNCRQVKAVHTADGACLFDFTMFREENVNDHLDCTCERVVEEGNTTVTPDGKVTVDMTVQDKRLLEFITMSFLVS